MTSKRWSTRHWVFTLIALVALVVCIVLAAGTDLVVRFPWDQPDVTIIDQDFQQEAAPKEPVPTDEPVPTEAPVVEKRTTWKFDYPDAARYGTDTWNVDGLSMKMDSSTILMATGVFKNTIPGTEPWLAEPGTKLVGPDYPVDKVVAEGRATEYISPVNQELIDAPGESFHVNEDRIDFCSFGAAKLEVNGVRMSFDYKPGHNWFFVVRGLFPDGLQDVDRNHTILFEDVVGSHAQCMSYPGNGGGFISQGNFEQVAELSHKNANNCGAEGCSGLTAVFLDLNTGAFSVINQVQLGQPWTYQFSNWLY
ncbi:MAG TPA: hypothetical protein VJ227_03710 [Patescibacteria group bacterium]|nr:hypothetical protein [Patescibacteria group bacterium]